MKGCDCCRHEETDMGSFEARNPMRLVNLCSFCSQTFSGNTVLYGSYSHEDSFTATLIAQLYWKLKEELDKKQDKRIS
jgi:hypothetical protein